MTEYMLKKSSQLADKMEVSGKLFDIKKLRKPFKFDGKKKKFRYLEINSNHFMTKKFIKENFIKKPFRIKRIKQIFPVILLVVLYNLIQEKEK
ncbi:hypothetical protein [Staphylococcus equorum]|uniref:Uncharacterized protein n=1 Tax=Staphylococcus equorum TaxID=246432 RepID=A0A9X4LBA5_9STAP|nr:hypothetical protein [Staphylococcus equorum]MDG0860360.1 hypothetical protein [Staphylococcus equorum]